MLVISFKDHAITPKNIDMVLNQDGKLMVHIATLLYRQNSRLFENSVSISQHDKW